ncbi:MAG: thioesterase family protein [Bacteroidota bacterium]
MFKTYQGSVYPWHCDQMGHMNVKFYTGKFDQANFQLFAMLGLNREYFAGSPFGMAAVEQNTRYHKEIFPGENIYIESTIEGLKEKVVTNLHTMIKTESGAVAATTKLVCVHYNRITKRSQPFPHFVAQNFKTLYP